MKLIKGLGYLLFIALLTVVTQVGGLVYLISLWSYKKWKHRLVFFLLLYGLSTFIIVPWIAPYFGRVPIVSNEQVQLHTWFTRLANRQYVIPELQEVLQQTAITMQQTDPEFELHVLDANFPFFDGFPLLPHLSHNDGKKVDISFAYTTSTGEHTNAKPSRSGYGIFEGPMVGEYDQIASCKSQGYWQYDFPKYLTFGTSNSELVFASMTNKRLVRTLAKQAEVQKIFIEPHLKTRLQLNHAKVRYHGCRAVRHDDHIHVQLR